MIDRVIDSRGLDSFDLRFMGLIAVILSVGVLSIYSVTHSQDTAFPLSQTARLDSPRNRRVSGDVPIRLSQDCALGVSDLCGHSNHARDRLFMGKSSRGAQRWIPIGPFAFQPSEFAKLVLVLVLANYYSRAPRVGWLHRVVLPGLIVLPGLLLILKQPDLGSGLSFCGLCGDAADGRRPFQSLGDYSVALGHVVSVCLGDGLGLTSRLPARTVMAFIGSGL